MDSGARETTLSISFEELVGANDVAELAKGRKKFLGFTHVIFDVCHFEI